MFCQYLHFVEINPMAYASYCLLVEFVFLFILYLMEEGIQVKILSFKQQILQSFRKIGNRCTIVYFLHNYIYKEIEFILWEMVMHYINIS